MRVEVRRAGNVNTRVRPAIYSAVLCVAILSSGGARAEGFIDVYLGGSYTDDATTRYSSMASATTKFDDYANVTIKGDIETDHFQMGVGFHF